MLRKSKLYFKIFFYLNNAVAWNLQQLGKYLTTVYFYKLFSSFDFIPSKDIWALVSQVLIANIHLVTGAATELY